MGWMAAGLNVRLMRVKSSARSYGVNVDLQEMEQLTCMLKHYVYVFIVKGVSGADISMSSSRKTTSGRPPPQI